MRERGQTPRLPLVKALQGGLCLPQLLLYLHAPIEDRAIARGAQDVLMQAALAALALRPQRAELCLQVVHRQNCPLVDLALLWGGVKYSG